MRLIDLSVEKFQELKPFVDTLILPVCSIGNGKEGEPFAHDLLVIRKFASRVDEQISGRVFLLPEAVHTSPNEGQSGMPAEVLADYLFHVFRPYKEAGFSKVVLLYGTGTPDQAIDQAISKLKDQGFEALSLSVHSGQSDYEALVQQIIGLWNQQK